MALYIIYIYIYRNEIKTGEYNQEIRINKYIYVKEKQCMFIYTHRPCIYIERERGGGVGGGKKRGKR